MSHNIAFEADTGDNAQCFLECRGRYGSSLRWAWHAYYKTCLFDGEGLKKIWKIAPRI